MILHENRNKWLRFILRERLGIDLTITQDKNEDYILAICGTNKYIRILSLAEVFEKIYPVPYSTVHLLDSSFLPSSNGPLPAPGLRTPLFELFDWGDDSVTIRYDILGLMFWTMSRYEELNHTELDNHLRFSAKSSHAFIHNYLDRPIVDEWLLILSNAIKILCPELSLARHYFKIHVSHDVDRPSRYGLCGLSHYATALASDVIKKKNYKNALLSPLIYCKTRHELQRNDEYNTFDWIMTQSEQIGIKSSFFFIAGKTNDKYDPGYSLKHPAISKLMLSIYNRGHEVGLHPSYDTYLNSQAFLKEAENLKESCDELGIKQEKWGGRMHYLRWKTPNSLYAWEKSGMSYVNTHGYADYPGFRCGTCFEYPAYDPIKENYLDLRIKPLIAMEVTVLSSLYMNISETQDALDVFLSLKKACQSVQGEFSLLWHNNHMITPQQRTLYTTILTN